MGWYDIPELPLEPPENRPIAYCAHCGGEIYEGEFIYVIDAEPIHEDCLADFAAKHFADCKKLAG